MIPSSRGAFRSGAGGERSQRVVTDIEVSEGKLKLSTFHVTWIAVVGILAATNLVSTWVSFAMTRSDLKTFCANAT